MKAKIIQYLINLVITLVAVVAIGLVVIISLNGSVHYSDHPAKKNWINEGPYAFYESDSTFKVNYISGNKSNGFHASDTIYDASSAPQLPVFFNLDSSSFTVPIDLEVHVPPCIYQDSSKILAVSDIESGFRTFRDFLINNQVIDQNLEWTFGCNHLVLVGDFVDRGNSTMQVLWLIYKLEQEARKSGGVVHFILGNHEIKNLQGNFFKASQKYFFASSILNKQQYQLFDSFSIIGRWLESKNTIEVINHHLFVHGGIHPDLSNYETDIYQVNGIVRQRYRQAYFPSGKDSIEELLLSTTKGPSWYRGYFRDRPSQDDIELGLKLFNANDVIVGHTIQRKVKKMHEGRVFSLDVNHPKDYRKDWPKRSSEGLLIDKGIFYRALHDGSTIEL